MLEDGSGYATAGVPDGRPAPLHPTPRPAGHEPDRELRARLRDFARDHPRWGHRRAHAVLVRDGYSLNRKKAAPVA